MMTMKFKNILMALGLGSMLMTSCTLDEEVYTFISGEDLSADGEYEPGDVSGFPFDDTCGSRIHYAAYRRDGDSRICVSAGRGIS